MVTMYHFDFILFGVAKFKAEEAPIKTSEVKAQLSGRGTDVDACART